MSLKLFRSTGYASILEAGETRAAMHPAWIVLVTSLWAGFACNVALWRQLGARPGAIGMAQSLALGAFIAGGCGLFLSLLGWRKTLKPAATLVLLFAAVSASAIWVQGAPLDAGMALRPWNLVPSWASLLRWQVSLLLVVLAVVPTVWVWNSQVRRLPGPRQLSSNLAGMLAAAVVMAGAGVVLFGGAP